MQAMQGSPAVHDDGLWAIRRAATEQELVEAAREYLDDWTSYDWCRLPALARPCELETPEDLLVFAIGVLDCSLACPLPSVIASVSPSAERPGVLRKNSWQERCQTAIGRFALIASRLARSSLPCQSGW